MVLGLNARRIESVGLGTNSLRQQIDLVEARIMPYSHGKKVEMCSVPPGKGFCSVNDAYSSRLSRMCVAEKANPQKLKPESCNFLELKLNGFHQQQRQLNSESSINLLDASPKVVDGFKRRREREAT
jgi:hypothetical protein